MTTRLKLTKTEMKNARDLGMAIEIRPNGVIAIVPVDKDQYGAVSSRKVEINGEIRL